MARLNKTVQVIQVDLLELDGRDLRILDMALSMYKDYDNKQLDHQADEFFEGEFFPLGRDDRLALNALHNHVLDAKVDF